MSSEKETRIPSDEEIKVWVEKFYTDPDSVWKKERGKNWDWVSSMKLLQIAMLLQAGHYSVPPLNQSQD